MSSSMETILLNTKKEEEHINWKEREVIQWKNKAKTCYARNKKNNTCSLIEEKCNIKNCLFNQWSRG